MGDIKINDLNEEMTLSEEALAHVRGGIALLLPAVQKVYIQDGTSNTLAAKKSSVGSV